MRSKITFFFLICFLPVVIQSQCTMANYASAFRIPSTSYPYYSSSAAVTVSVTTVNVPTLSDVAYTCGANNYAGGSPAWWLNSATGQVRLTFSAPVTNLTVLVNGTNQTEIFYFAAGTGAISLSNFCTAGFVGSGSQVSYTATPTVGSIITLNNPTGSTTYTFSHNGTGSGSRVTLLDCFLKLTPLPVELTSLSGKCNNSVVNLEWETATEHNNKEFAIERSLDGSNWEEIGKVNGAGNSASPKYYSFTDPKPNNSILYYRLKQTDHNKEFNYTKLITVNFCTQRSDMVIYPNPAKDEIIISGWNIESIELHDVYGSEMINKTIYTEEDLKIDITQLQKGIYFLKVNGKIHKVVKE